MYIKYGAQFDEMCIRHKEKFVDLSKRFAQINGAKASCNKTQECPTLFIFRKG